MAKDKTKKINPVRKNEAMGLSNGVNISKSLNKLEEIVEWFQKQEDVDVEMGLEKLKEAAPILKDLKSRIKGIENDFEEIKKEVDIEK